MYLVWIEFVGKVMVFVAFFLVSPEVIGEQRLRAVSQNMLRFLALLAAVVVGVLLSALCALLLYLLVKHGLPALGISLEPQPAKTVGLQVPGQPGSPPPPAAPNPAMGYLFMGLLYLAFALVVAFPIGCAIGVREGLSTHFVRPVIQWLADNERARLRWLKIGVWLFVIGSLLDMGWWVWEKQLKIVFGIA